MSDLVNSNPPLKVFTQPTAANDGFVLLNWSKEDQQNYSERMESVDDAMKYALEQGWVFVEHHRAKSLAMDLQCSIPSKTLSIKDQTFS